MTKFIECGVYVDDKTGAVYECVDEQRQQGLCLKRISQPLTNVRSSLYLEIGKNLNAIELIFGAGKETPLRPWQESDEPSSYDIKRWGKVEIVKVYKAKQYDISDFYYICGVSKGKAFGISYHEQNSYLFNAEKENFIAYITRPAFPNEIAGLKLPQIEGEITL